MFQYIEENQSVIQQKFVDFINHDLAYSSSVSCFLQKSKSSLLALCFFSATVATISLLLTPIAHAETTTNLYKVQRGDTLLGVANKFQISAKELATENKKQITDNLLTNEILILPSTVFASAATAATNTTTAKASPAKTPTKVATTSTTKNPFYDTKQIPTDKLSITTQTTYKSISTEPYTIKMHFL